MSKIYTKTGDAGETGLLGGARAGKDAARIAAIGAVDEANAALGFARSQKAGARFDAVLARLQAELFELGAELASPPGAKTAGRIRASHVEALEHEIDNWTSELPPLTSFILPGGGPAGAALHVARGACRRAERELVALSRSEAVSSEALKYVNRLSDHLFTLARAVNRDAGAFEPPWKPAA